MQIKNQLDWQLSENKKLQENLCRLDRLHTIIDNRLLTIQSSIKALSQAIEVLERENIGGELNRVIGTLKAEREGYKQEIEQIRVDDEVKQLTDLLGITQEQILEAQRDDILETINMGCN